MIAPNRFSHLWNEYKEDHHAWRNEVIDYIRHNRKAVNRLSKYENSRFAISFLIYTEVMAGSHLRLKAETKTATIDS